MAYKFKITIDSTKVSGSSHTNFAYLFSESCSGIPSGFWSHVSDSSGLDVRFYDSTESQELKREIVSFSSGSQTIEAWVQVPSLSGSSDTEIWCYYGGDTRSSDTGVWDDIDGRGIYHFGSNANDSSGNGNNGTVYGATFLSNGGHNGKGCYDLDGVNDYINLGNSSTLGFTSSFTLSAWVYPRLVNGHDSASIVDKWGTTSQINYGLIMFRTSYWGPVNHIQFRSTGFGYKTTNSSVPRNAWSHFVSVYDQGTNQIRLYINGVLDKIATPDGPPVLNSGNVLLGRIPYYLNDDYDGRMDEVRIIGQALSDDWVASEYANQNFPSLFSSAGAEEEVGAAEQISIIWIPGII